MKSEARELALLPDPGIGQPDRRHQVAVAEAPPSTIESMRSVLQAKRREALDLLGVCDLDRPALLLERVVDEPSAGHRLDHGADGLCVDVVDPAGEGPQRAGVGRDGELVEVLALGR